MSTITERAPQYSFHVLADGDIIPLGPGFADGQAGWSRADELLPSLDLPGIPSLVAQEMHGTRHLTAPGDVETLLRRAGFDWEPATEPGHMRLLPPAAFILSQVLHYAETSTRRMATALGLPFESISGINVIDGSADMLRNYMRLLDAATGVYGTSPYRLADPTSTLLLRQTSCLQKYSVARDWVLDDRHLPRCLYELSDSFRREREADLELCFRLRRFHLPESHIHSSSLGELQELGLGLHEQITAELGRWTDGHVLLLTASDRFASENPEYLQRLAATTQRPALLKVCGPDEMCEDGIELDVEYKIVDGYGHARELSTFQLDELITRAFGFASPLVTMHAVPLGGAERFVYAVFDLVSSRLRSGVFAHLPLWMTPTAVRAVWERGETAAAETARRIAVTLEASGIRTDLDDRPVPLGRKLHEARQDLVPYQILVDRATTDHDLAVLGPDTPGAGPLDPEPADAWHETLSDFITRLTNRRDFKSDQTPAVSPTLSSQPWRRSE